LVAPRQTFVRRSQNCGGAPGDHCTAGLFVPPAALFGEGGGGGALARVDFARDIGRGRVPLKPSQFKPLKPPQSNSLTFLLTRVTRIFQKSVFTEPPPAARAGCRAGFFVARTQAAPAHASIAMQTAGCNNERPLFRDCSLQ